MRSRGRPRRCQLGQRIQSQFLWRFQWPPRRRRLHQRSQARKLQRPRKLYRPLQRPGRPPGAEPRHATHARRPSQRKALVHSSELWMLQAVTFSSALAKMRIRPQSGSARMRSGDSCASSRCWRPSSRLSKRVSELMVNQKKSPNTRRKRSPPLQTKRRSRHPRCSRLPAKLLPAKLLRSHRQRRACRHPPAILHWYILLSKACMKQRRHLF
mmetsp:Transcript_57489/g.108167  ORF Transcript_57489/g.108167 Transcript_57489/m.108167 type:complete len:212 (+) Transcript_57489:455-1090(+)